MSPGRTILGLTAALMLSTGINNLAAQSKNTIPPAVGDLGNAQLVEVRDQSGQVLLHGTFKTSSNKPKETERKADLESPSGQESKGKVEVEIAHKDAAAIHDEVEASMEKLPAMTQFELFIDGRHVTSFMTSKSGKAKVKLDRKLAGR
jgi:hypothetical protein